MAESYDLLIHNGRVFTPEGLVETDIAVRAGKVAALGRFDPGRADRSIDASGLTVLPGVIDSQVHFREPGLEHKEDLESGTRSAALGGVTAVFEMPNTSPSTLTAEDLNEKLRRAEGRAWVDHAFYIGAAAENADDLDTLELLPGCCGVKVFMGASTGSLLVSDDETLYRVLSHGRRRVAIHAEDEYRLEERYPIRDAAADCSAHPEWRDAESAVLATQRVLRLARAAGRRIHVLHISTADEMPILAQHKDIASVEVTPQHLTLAAPECYEQFGSKAQMNPPIRDDEHRQGLWWGVRQGIADVIGSDHAPHTAEEKAKPYPGSPSGMPGVQTLVPLMLDHVHNGRLSLARFVDMTSAGPARLFGLAGKGRIAAGYDADFTLIDPKAQRQISRAWLAYKCGWSPFEGRIVNGWPIATIVRGNVVMRDDELQDAPIGQPCLFQDTLPHPGLN